MGKYSSIASRLVPKLEPQSFQDRVDEAKAGVRAVSHSDLAHQIVSIREEKERIKNNLNEVNIRMVAYEQLLVDAFESAGVSGVKLDSGDSISTQIRPYARVDDRRAFRDWCIEHGLAESLTLPWQTLNSLVSDRLVEGLPEPDGISSFKQTTVVVRKGRR